MKVTYLPTIGIECHVQLKTKTKLFSGVDNDARDAAPNSKVSPICFGLPGTLPVLNEAATRLAIRAGIALNAKIAKVSSFDRKHYFYPDLPKGYQITQLERPIVGEGSIDIPGENGDKFTVRITRAHLEEDAGKLTHPSGADYSLVDLNRVGTPLLEIVSEADMHSAAEAKAYAHEVYLLMTYAGVTDGDLYHGNMRFDINVSVAPQGSKSLGNRAEIKNLNSFKSIEKATNYEIKRQSEILQRNEVVTQETRGWDESRQKTLTQRSKEDALEYRYFPDADLPPIVVTENDINKVKASMPILPPAIREKLTGLKLDPTVINALFILPQNMDTVLKVIEKADPKVAKRTANWFANSVQEEEPAAMSAEISVATDIDYFTQLSDMVENDEISSNSAKEIFSLMLDTNQPPKEIAKQNNMLQTSDNTKIEKIVDEVLNDPESAKAVEDIKNGNQKAIGYLIGQAMKKSSGNVNPAILSEIIKLRLK